MSHQLAANDVSESSRAQLTASSADMQLSNTESHYSTYRGPSGHSVYFEEDSVEEAVLNGDEVDHPLVQTTQMKGIDDNTTIPGPLDSIDRARAPGVANADGGTVQLIERLSIRDWVSYLHDARQIAISLQPRCGRVPHDTGPKVDEMDAIFHAAEGTHTTFKRALACLTAAEALEPYRPKLSRFKPSGDGEDAVRTFHYFYVNGTGLITHLIESHPHPDDLHLLNYAMVVFKELRDDWMTLFRALDDVAGPNEDKLAPPLSPPPIYEAPPAVAQAPRGKLMKAVHKARKIVERGLGKALAMAKGEARYN